MSPRAPRRRVTVKRAAATEDRVHAGTKSQRDKTMPLAFKVRYWIAMGAFLACAFGAGVAVNKAISSKQESGRAAQLAQTTQALTHRVAALAARNTMLTHRVATDEQKTCVIQARGLPASHHLAVVIGDIGNLISLGSLNQAHARGVPPRAVRLLLSLQSNSTTYERLEAKQPSSRKC